MKEVELGSSVDLITKGTTPTSLGKPFTEVGVKFLRAQNVINGRVLLNEDILHIDEETHRSLLKRSQIKNGDVLLTIAGTIGRTAIVKSNEQLNCNQAVAIIRLGESNIDANFLCHFLASENAHSQFNKGKVTATISNLSLGQVKKLKIPLPPLETQKKIASILDAADAYRQKTKALIQKYDELTQSLFLEMFGDPVTNPKGWNEGTVDEVSQLTTKGSSPKWQGFGYTKEGVRFITSENVRLGYMDCSKDKFVNIEFHEKLLRSQLKENDLLVNLVGASIGRGALVSKDELPANINQAVAKTELDFEKVNPVFVLNQIITPQLQERLIGNKVEGARANISLKNVRELKLYIPPLELQNQFAERIQEIEKQKAQAQESLKKAEELFSSLLQRAFKGELV